MTKMKMKMSASRLGAMVGADPRMSRLALFNELKYSDYEYERDAGKRTGNQAVDSGIKFEQAIAEMACEQYGMEILQFGGPDKLATADGTLVGHPDRYVMDENGETAILECKLLFRVPEELSHEWGPAGSDQVPVHYYLQALAYAMMAGLKRSYLAAWIAGVGVRRYIIERNKPIEDHILEDVKDMLQRVATDNPPDAFDEADMRARWFAQRTKEIEVRLRGLRDEPVQARQDDRQPGDREEALEHAHPRHHARRQ
jgi:predicted phage-related endonuclease